MRPRSQAQLLWMGSEFDAVPEHVPDWNRHLRLAREMLDTQAHRLKPHTHPAHSPARPADTRIPLTSPLLCRVQGELWRNPPSQDVILLGVSFDFWQCGELELRIAKPHSAPSTTLRRFRGCFPTRLLSNDEAEALADCTACSSCLVSVLCVSSEWWRCVCGVLGTGSSRSPRRSGIRVAPKSRADATGCMGCWGMRGRVD